MAQAAYPRSRVDSVHSKPQVQGGKHPLPAPVQRQKSQLFLRTGVEAVLSHPIQNPGVIPLIQRCFEQHPCPLLCLDHGSSGAWAGHEPSVGPSPFLCSSLDAGHPEYSGAIPCLVQGVQLCIRDNTGREQEQAEVGTDLLCNIQGSWSKSLPAWMCPNPCWWHLRCQGRLHGGRTP